LSINFSPRPELGTKADFEDPASAGLKNIAGDMVMPANPALAGLKNLPKYENLGQNGTWRQTLKAK
jgi:hypothetical protein